MYNKLTFSVLAVLLTQAAGHSSNSHFLDSHFGPIDYVKSDSRLIVQKDQFRMSGDSYDSDHDFISIPNKDYTDDLGPDGPVYPPVYAGIVTFAHLPLMECFGSASLHHDIDIAIVGAPFDTSTSYRPGARFGPSGIREGSRRMSSSYSAYRPEFNAYQDFTIVECGDIPMTPFDNRYALDQLYRGHRAILNHSVATVPKHSQESYAPRIITLGGDHTITFSALRAAYEKHGPISVVHFDSHIDTWDPKLVGGNISSYSDLNHGTFLHYAFDKGYIKPDSSIHIGIRAPYFVKHKDQRDDRKCGFEAILARDIDEIGVKGIITKIKQRIGKNKLYITVDIDSLDPAYAPGTGTAEPGGFTTRELLTILDGLEDLNIIGADVVEVAPAYDSAGQITVLAAAEVVHSLLSLMVLGGQVPL